MLLHDLERQCIQTPLLQQIEDRGGGVVEETTGAADRFAESMRFPPAERIDRIYSGIEVESSTEEGRHSWGERSVLESFHENDVRNLLGKNGAEEARRHTGHRQKAEVSARNERTFRIYRSPPFQVIHKDVP